MQYDPGAPSPQMGLLMSEITQIKHAILDIQNTIQLVLEKGSRQSGSGSTSQSEQLDVRQYQSLESNQGQYSGSRGSLQEHFALAQQQLLGINTILDQELDYSRLEQQLDFPSNLREVKYDQLQKNKQLYQANSAVSYMTQDYQNCEKYSFENTVDGRGTIPYRLYHTMGGMTTNEQNTESYAAREAEMQAFRDQNQSLLCAQTQMFASGFDHRASSSGQSQTLELQTRQILETSTGNQIFDSALQSANRTLIQNQGLIQSTQYSPEDLLKQQDYDKNELSSQNNQTNRQVDSQDQCTLLTQCIYSDDQNVPTISGSMQSQQAQFYGDNSLNFQLYTQNFPIQFEGVIYISPCFMQNDCFQQWMRENYGVSQSVESLTVGFKAILEYLGCHDRNLIAQSNVLDVQDVGGVVNLSAKSACVETSMPYYSYVDSSGSKQGLQQYNSGENQQRIISEVKLLEASSPVSSQAKQKGTQSCPSSPTKRHSSPKSKSKAPKSYRNWSLYNTSNMYSKATGIDLQSYQNFACNSRCSQSSSSKTSFQTNSVLQDQNFNGESSCNACQFPNQNNVDKIIGRKGQVNLGEGVEQSTSSSVECSSDESQTQTSSNSGDLDPQNGQARVYRGSDQQGTNHYHHHHDQSSTVIQSYPDENVWNE